MRGAMARRRFGDVTFLRLFAAVGVFFLSVFCYEKSLRT